MSGKNITVGIASSIIRFAVLAVIVVFAFRLATKAYDFGYRVFAEPAVSSEPGVDITVAITDDMNTMDIGKLLKSKKLITDANLFYVQEKVSEYKGKIQPGNYVLNTSMTAEEMMAIMGATADETTEAYVGNEESPVVEETTEIVTEEEE